MKSKRQLFVSVFQAVVGILAIASFVILGAGGENMIKWAGTLILSVAFVIMGVSGILDYRSGK